MSLIEFPQEPFQITAVNHVRNVDAITEQSTQQGQLQLMMPMKVGVDNANNIVVRKVIYLPANMPHFS